MKRLKKGDKVNIYCTQNARCEPRFEGIATLVKEDPLGSGFWQVRFEGEIDVFGRHAKFENKI